MQSIRDSIVSHWIWIFHSDTSHVLTLLFFFRHKLSTTLSSSSCMSIFILHTLPALSLCVVRVSAETDFPSSLIHSILLSLSHSLFSPMITRREMKMNSSLSTDIIFSPILDSLSRLRRRLWWMSIDIFIRWQRAAKKKKLEKVKSCSVTYLEWRITFFFVHLWGITLFRSWTRRSSAANLTPSTKVERFPNQFFSRTLCSEQQSW